MKKLSLAIIAILGMSFGALAQADTKTDNHTITITIPEVALLDIELAGASKNISTTFTAPTEAGLPITGPTTGLNTLWLNYSSIVESAGADMSRTVTVSATSLVPGTVLNVSAGTPVVAGGSGGTPVAITSITATGQTIISGIGSVYTGDGVGAGSNITYSLTAPAGTYGSLMAGSTPVIVTYTLSDN